MILMQSQLGLCAKTSGMGKKRLIDRTLKNENLILHFILFGLKLNLYSSLLVRSIIAELCIFVIQA